MVSTAHAVKAELHAKRSRPAVKVTAYHIPSPRLAAAIERMKKGEGIEYESVEAFRRAVELKKKKLSVR